MFPRDRWFFCLALLLLWHNAGHGQRPSIDPPPEWRPPDFSNIVGKYTIRATAAPTEVQVEQPITLRIVITGEGPAKYEPKRESLRIIAAAWDKDFYVEEIPEEYRVDRAAKTWSFGYRLRPKHAKIDAIDGIKLSYYDPDARGKKKFLLSSEEPIKIVVKPKPEDLSAIVLPPIAPSSFYQHVALAETWNVPAISEDLSLLLLTVVAVATPMACILGAFLWKRYHPDAGERHRRRRNRAADQAVSRLRARAAPVWEIVNRYLVERLDLPAEDPTPAEVSAFLLRRGFAKELCGQWEILLQKCDATRYARELVPSPGSLIENAIGSIAALEADPCAR